MTYSRVCVAGTFDRIHAGHEALLTRAFAQGSRVIVGVTSDAFVATYKHGRIRGFSARKSALATWLRLRGLSDRADIVRIDDPYAPASTDAAVDALVVSGETQHRGADINARRTASGLAPLAILVVPMVAAYDNAPVSARRIRDGEIDAVGNLLLPDSLRTELAEPFGTVLDRHALRRSLGRQNCGTNQQIISVGDRTTKTILEFGVSPNIMIIDHKVNRMPFYDLDPVFRMRAFPVVHVASGPGFISSSAIHAIRNFFTGTNRNISPTVLDVDGEEDLLTLCVIDECPIGTVVYYGQPKLSTKNSDGREGVVEVSVTRNLKKRVRLLLSGFVRSGKNAQTYVR